MHPSLIYGKFDKFGGGNWTFLLSQESQILNSTGNYLVGTKNHVFYVFILSPLCYLYCCCWILFFPTPTTTYKWSEKLYNQKKYVLLFKKVYKKFSCVGLCLNSKSKQKMISTFLFLKFSWETFPFF